MEKIVEKTKKNKEEKAKEEKLVGTRGRIFQGTVTKVFPKRAVIEFERTVYIGKYERYFKKKTRIHARVPEGFEVKIGDVVHVHECRPLSKIIHFIVTEKVGANK
jgi:small subunit ribosomal protein S17